MSRENFINPKTGELFAIGEFKMKADDSYTDKWNKVLVDPKDGTVLELIPKDGPVGAPMQIGTSQERLAQQTQHFKARAKKHAKSDEGKALKRKAMDREFGNMGLERKK